jgi:hypothetical protein
MREIWADGFTVWKSTDQQSDSSQLNQHRTAIRPIQVLYPHDPIRSMQHKYHQYFHAIPCIHKAATKALFQIIIGSANEMTDIAINMKGRGASECAQN